MDNRNESENKAVGGRETLWILLAGSWGGLLLWLWQNVSGEENKLVFSLYPNLTVIACMMLGAGSAFIFIFLIAIIDLKDLKRLLALALLSGFAWQAVWDSAQDRLMLSREDSSDVNFSKSDMEAAERAYKTKDQVPQHPTDGDGSAVEQAGEESSDIWENYMFRFISRSFGIEDIDRDEFDNIQSLMIGTPHRSSKNRYTFRIDGQADISIDVETEDGKDLIMALFRYDSKNNKLQNLVSFDDDSGEGLNPSLKIDEINEGDYLLAINFFEADGSLSLEDSVGEATVQISTNGPG